jgi:poly(A) polymerase
LRDPPWALSVGADRTTLRQALYRVGDAALYQDLVLLAAADAPGPFDLAALRDGLAVAEDLPSLRLPIAGRDLLALGVERGPALGALLKRIEAWWIAGDFQADRTACLEEARRLIDA